MRWFIIKLATDCNTLLSVATITPIKTFKGNTKIILIDLIRLQEVHSYQITYLTCLWKWVSSTVGISPIEYHPKNSIVENTCLTECEGMQ